MRTKPKRSRLSRRITRLRSDPTRTARWLLFCARLNRATTSWYTSEEWAALEQAMRGWKERA